MSKLCKTFIKCSLGLMAIVSIPAIMVFLAYIDLLIPILSFVGIITLGMSVVYCTYNGQWWIEGLLNEFVDNLEEYLSEHSGLREYLWYRFQHLFRYNGLSSYVFQNRYYKALEKKVGAELEWKG